MTGKTQDWSRLPVSSEPPNFENLLKVLRCEKPERATLFEFFLNESLYLKLARQSVGETLPLGPAQTWLRAFANTGYDYATVSARHLNTLSFPTGEREQKASISQNVGGIIHDNWPVHPV